MNLKQILCIAGSLACLAMAACKKSESGNDTPSGPVVSAKGVAIGTPVTTSIGAAGGELVSEDGKVTMIIPAGAVQQNTTFSIQPITNTLYDNEPSRMAYRLLPEGTTFAKPVKLVFHYEEEDLVGSVEDFMTIAWQQPEGSWKVEPCRLDKPAKTLTVETTHFSDWTKTGGFEIRYKEKLRPGEKTEIYVVSMAEDNRLARIGVTDAQLAKITSMGKWKILKGAGSLQPVKVSGGFETTAIYTAPASVNQVELVEITMEIEGFNHIKDPGAPGGVRRTGKMILFAKLTVSDNMFTGKFDNVGFGFFGTEVVAVGLDRLITIRGGNESGEISLMISAVGKGSFPCGPTFMPGKSAVTVTVGSANYGSSYISCAPGGEIYFSPSSVTITEWPVIGGVLEGNFSGVVYVNDGQCGAHTKQLSFTFRVVRSG